MTVTYIDVLHKGTLRLHSFIHIPNIPVTATNSYTPFPDLEKVRPITNQTFAQSGTFDLARAVESNVSTTVEKLMDSLADSTPETNFPLQVTLDGYCWKSIAHWLAVEPRLKAFHSKDHMFMLCNVVLEMRDAVLSCFCYKAEATDTISEVFFRPAASSSPRNIRTLPLQSQTDMQAIAIDANDSLTMKAFMSTNVSYAKKSDLKEFHPLEMLVSDPWLLFTLRTLLSQDSPLFAFLQKSKKLEPTQKAVVFAVRETFTGERGIEYIRQWTDTRVDFSIGKSGPEGIPLVTITSPLVAQLDTDGILGSRVKDCGGMFSSHGQNQHTTLIFLMSDTAYVYDDTLPFLNKIVPLDNNELGSKCARLLKTLEHLLVYSHVF